MHIYFNLEKISFMFDSLFFITIFFFLLFKVLSLYVYSEHNEVNLSQQRPHDLFVKCAILDICL